MDAIAFQVAEARARVHAMIDTRVLEIKRLMKAVAIRDNRSLGQRIRWMRKKHETR